MIKKRPSKRNDKIIQQYDEQITELMSAIPYDDEDKTTLNIVVGILREARDKYQREIEQTPTNGKC